MDDKKPVENTTAAPAENSVSDSVQERNILSAPVVHTNEGGGIHIPDSETDEITLGLGTSRFIKSVDTQFVTASSSKKDDELPTDISKFTDRLTARAPEKKPHTGYTGKIKTFPESHAAAPADGRMITGTPLDDVTIGESAAEDDTKTYIPESAAPVTEKLSENDSLADENTDEGSINEPPTKKLKYPTENNGQPDFGDSSPTKHIKSKSELLREIAGTADDDKRVNPDQLMMEGFDKPEEPEITEEEDPEIKNALHETRQKRINSFNFWGKKAAPETSEVADERFSTESEKKLPDFLQNIANRFADKNSSFVPVNSEEYTDFNHRKGIFSNLISTRKTTIIKTFIVAILGLVLCIINLSAGVSAANNNGFFTIFGGNSYIYLTVNLVILLLYGIIMAGDIKNGIISLLKIRPKADTFLSFLFFISLAQNIAGYFTQLKLESDFHMFSAATVLICLPYMLAKLFYCDNTRQCFKAVAAKSEKSYLRKISDSELCAELLRDKNASDENIVYSGKTKFIKSFIARCADSAFAGMPSSRLVVIGIGISVIAGIAAAIINKSPVYGITAASLTALLSFPVSCLTATGFAIAKENKSLSLKSSFVQSYSDARDFASVDNLVLDSSDIIDAKLGTLLSAKFVKDKQAAFCAAVLCNKAGGMLSKTFSKYLEGYESKIPEVEQLVYEDKLGLSAWISGCKVLLGTHTLLRNHNVEVPDEKIVMRILKEGETPVFLALEGSFAAVFGITYSSKTTSGDSLKALVNSGTNLLLSTLDANITDTFAEQLLSLPAGSVRIITQKALGVMNTAKAAVTDDEEAGIVFTDSIDSLCRCAGSAVNLDRIKTLSKGVCTAGSAAGLVLALALVFTGAFTKVSTFVPVFSQVIWLIACFAAPAMFSGMFINMKKRSADTKKAERSKKPEQDTVPDLSDINSDNTQVGTEADLTENTVADNLNNSNSKEKAAGSNAAFSEKESENSTGFVPPEDNTPHHISAETFDALDALAEKPDRTKKRRSAIKTSANDEDDANDNSFEQKQSSGGIIGGITSAFSRFLSSKSAGENEADEESEEGGTEEENRNASSGSFSFAKKGKKRDLRASSESPEEQAYNEQKADEERTRQKFTPPEMPVAPHYNLNEKPAEEFTPPKPSTPTVYTDSMFKAFTNDDDIFAGLRETPTDKFDF